MTGRAGGASLESPVISEREGLDVGIGLDDIDRRDRIAEIRQDLVICLQESGLDSRTAIAMSKEDLPLGLGVREDGS